MQIIFLGSCIECPAFSLLVAIERVNLWQNFFYDHEFHTLLFLFDSVCFIKLPAKNGQKRILVRYEEWGEYCDMEFSNITNN